MQSNQCCEGIWLGGTYNKSTGIWTWNSKRALGYTNWSSGQPDNPKDEFCLSMWLNLGQWNDIGCNSNSGAITQTTLCEKIFNCP